MFKSRFLLALGLLSLLLAGMAYSRPFSKAAKEMNLSRPSRPVIIPKTGAADLSDYGERHQGLTAPAEASSHRTDSARDECFDVSISEVTACRIASQAVAQSSGTPLDTCFDVSISEVASCREAEQTSSP